MEYLNYLIPAVFLLFILLFLHIKYKDFPPGPYGLPFVGYQPFLGKNPVFTLTNLSKKYGSIVSVNLGNKNVVLLNDWNSVKEGIIKQAAVTSGRPYLHMQDLVFTNKDIIFSYGAKWKEQRHFTVNILKDFGVGRSSMETMIMYEVEMLTEYLNKHAGEPIDINNLFVIPVMNIIGTISVGKRFEEIDEFLIYFKEFCRITSSPGTYGMMDQIPVLRYLLPKLNKDMEDIKFGVKKMNRYIDDVIAKHEKKHEENNHGDFIDAYLSEIYKRRAKDPNGNDVPPFDKQHLMQTVIDLFIAGEDSTDVTMNWALLFMATNPKIQKKIQEELDAVVAKDSFLSMSSKALAPYTEATLLEVQRHPSLVPLSVPHMNTKDMTLFGYKIPKGTTIYPNIYAVHHDEQYWGDPHVFRPERFLNEDGTKVVKHECFIPFSVGHRACIGESLAKLELHLLFTSLLRRFTFETIPGEPQPSTEIIPGILFKLHPYSLIIKPR